MQAECLKRMLERCNFPTNTVRLSNANGFVIEFDDAAAKVKTTFVVMVASINMSHRKYPTEETVENHATN